ncbi:MAG: M20 family metallopeptidase [Actinomycetota bacterium]
MTDTHHRTGLSVPGRPGLFTTADRPAVDTATLAAEATDVLCDAVALRRAIHAEPELGLDLPLTQARVLDALADLDLDVSVGSSVSSVVATMVGDAEGPTILLRADMDALPMPEDTGLDFASRIDGVMHACGHDAHVAMLCGAARLLAARRSDMRGTVKFLFQPGEEGHHGARHCIEEGLLTAPEVDAAFALHISPNLASGHLTTKGGAIMASADELSIEIRGRGGHASAPHNAVDPVPVAAEVILAIQSHMTRSVNAFDPAVLTVTSLHAGTTGNVIPESAHMLGTIRAVSEATRARVHDGLHRVAHHVAAAHDCEATVEITRGYPVTVNDDDFVAFAIGVMEELVGSDRVSTMPAPIMGAEDWSYVLQQVPGVMAFLGVCPPGMSPGRAPSCHSNRMQLDEEAMATGIATHAAMALAYLA